MEKIKDRSHINLILNYSSLSSCHETSQRILRYGNSFPSTFPEVLLAHASPDDWPIVAKHANMTSSRQYKCDARDNYIRIFYFTYWIRNGYSLQDLRGTNRTAGSSPSLRRLPGPGPRRGGAGRVRLRTLRGPAGLRAPGPPRYIRGLFGVGLTAASVPLVGPPSPGGGSTVLPRRRTQRSPHSPVSFPEDCFRPPSNIEEFVSFGHEEGNDAMSISASEKEDWVGSEPDHLGSSEPSDLQEELMRVLSKAVQELELTWSPPEEPVRSKLDSWYFRSTRKANSRASVPFFPDSTRAAGEDVHSNTQAIFSHVDGAEAHGYVRSPPVEETVAAHLCPAAAKTLGSDISLPSKPCRTNAHLANKVYASDGEAASTLDVMAVLQVFQAKLLQAAEGGALTVKATKDLRAGMDFA